MNSFEFFEDLFEMFIFACLLNLLSYIQNLVLDNRAQLSWYNVITKMWFILIPFCWIIGDALFCEWKEKMRWGVNVVRLYIVRLPCIQKFIPMELYFGFECLSVYPLLEIIPRVDSLKITWQHLVMSLAWI